MPRCLICCCAFLFVLCASVSQARDYEPPEIRRVRVIREAGLLTDHDLALRLQICIPPTSFEWGDIELLLSEAVRRGGPRWRDCLTRLCEALNSTKLKRFENRPKFEHEISADQFNQPLMIALRQIQGQPDPLQIVIASDDPLVVRPLGRVRRKWMESIED